jgi:hypothetical protein
MATLWPPRAQTSDIFRDRPIPNVKLPANGGKVPDGAFRTCPNLERARIGDDTLRTRIARESRSSPGTFRKKVGEHPLMMAGQRGTLELLSLSAIRHLHDRAGGSCFPPARPHGDQARYCILLRNPIDGGPPSAAMNRSNPRSKWSLIWSKTHWAIG